MTRGIDHLVLCVRDLETARAAYARLGFTTTPRAQHPWGTDNFLVQLDGNFLELLTLARPELLPEVAEGHFGFGQFSQKYLAAREGFAMMVFESQHPARDRADFEAGGLATFAPFDFQRQAELPDGEEVTVGFSLTFTADPRMPDAAFFTCHQHAPQYFWKPEYQEHANGALQIVEAIMVAAQPNELRDFYVGMHGRDAVTTGNGQLCVNTARGQVTVLDGQAYAARFGAPEPAETPAGPHWAGFAVAVSDMSRAAALLDANGVSHADVDGAIAVGPTDNFGVGMLFVAGRDLG